MNTITITPKLVNNQYIFTLPDELKDQELQLEFILKVIYKPKIDDTKKELWFPDLVRIDLSNKSFRREDMYDDWGR